ASRSGRKIDIDQSIQKTFSSRSSVVKDNDDSNPPGKGDISTSWKTAEAISEDAATARNSHGGRRAGAGRKPLEFDLNLVAISAAFNARMKRLPPSFMSASARSSATRNCQDFGKP